MLRVFFMPYFFQYLHMKKIELSELAIYNLSINPEMDALVDAVALVQEPAHKSMYLAFNKTENVEQLFKANDVKQQVLGAAIIPEKLILREPNDAVNDWHFVKFSAEAIEEMAYQFYKNGFQNNININHTRESVSATFFQSIIIGDGLGQSKVNGLDLPNGTWVLGAYIEDKEVFEKVKQYGFSVEGLFRYSQYKNDFESEIDRLINNLNKSKQCSQY